MNLTIITIINTRKINKDNGFDGLYSFVHVSGGSGGLLIHLITHGLWGGLESRWTPYGPWPKADFNKSNEYNGVQPSVPRWPLGHQKRV